MARTNEGAEISVSMFDAMAEWMTVPLLHGEGGMPFKRIGLAHAAIAPYGVFKSRDGADILIAIQNDREWRVAGGEGAGRCRAGALMRRFATNPKRVENRTETDARVAASFAAATTSTTLMKKLEAADIAFARVNDWELLSKHAHLRRITVGAPSGPVIDAGAATVTRRRGAHLWSDPGARRTYGDGAAGVLPQRLVDRRLSTFAPGVGRELPMIRIIGMTASVRIISSLKSLI